MDGKIFARKSLLSFSAIVQPEKSNEYPGENKFEFRVTFKRFISATVTQGHSKILMLVIRAHMLMLQPRWRNPAV